MLSFLGSGIDKPAREEGSVFEFNFIVLCTRVGHVDFTKYSDSIG